MEERLKVLEGLVTDLRIAQARMDEKLTQHAAAAATAQAQVLAAVERVSKDIEPLKAARWRLHGVSTVLAMIVSAVVTYFLRKGT